MDPAYGEISRAMRNRGVEIAVAPLQVPSRDVLLCLVAHGVPGTHSIIIDFEVFDAHLLAKGTYMRC